MNRAFAVVLVIAMALALGSPALAAPPCKDGEAKCATHAAPKPHAPRCRDKTTKKFAKCAAPNSEPLPVKAKPA